MPRMTNVQWRHSLTKGRNLTEELLVNPTIVWIAILAALNLVWAGSYTIMKMATGSLDAFAIVFWRMAISALVLIAWNLIKRTSWRIAPRDLMRMLMVGVLTASSHVLVVAGINYSHASDASLLYVIEPVWGIVLGTLVLKERFSRGMFAGLMLIGTGIVVMTLSSGGILAGAAGTTVWLGNLIVIAGRLCEGSFSVAVKPVVARYSASITLMVIVASAAAVLAVPALMVSERMVPATFGEWGEVLYLALFCSVAGYLGWIVIMRHVPVNVMYFTIFIQPLTGPLIAWFVIGERIDAGLLIAGVLLIAGMAFAVSSHVLYVRGRRPDPAELAVDPV